MLDQLSSYTIPVFHPMMVHFPIVLTVLAAICCAGWLFRDHLFWLYSSIWLAALGFIGALLSTRTGETMEEQGEGIAIIDDLVQLHEQMAERVTWVLGISLVVLVFGFWQSRQDLVRPGTALWIRILSFILLLAAAVMVSLTAHIGGLMSWGVPA